MYKLIGKRLIIAICMSVFYTIFFEGYIFAEDCEMPDELTFSIVPATETMQDLAIYKPVLKHLQEVTGKKINFFMPTSRASVIEAMMSGFVDIAVHGPYSYILGNEKDQNIEVFATYIKKKGHITKEGPGYQAVIISKKGSKFTTIESLKGSTAALVDPASTSGNLVPRISFSKVIGVPIEDYFNKIVYSGGHDLSTIAVNDGKVDVAFVATHRFDEVINRGKVKKEDFNYVWFSDFIPGDPICYRLALCPDLRKKIEESFLNLHNIPAAANYLKNVRALKMKRMTSKDYNIIRELKKAKDKL
ncbi:phosphate/phosphite/phosphonate ABC transporter substrate-binding protein [Desulfobacula phenolica]|uniref:Phosphonate transport system substrate-binding protein n=1 Tax=Desulfobacula phenolica TaxID=90732 RepID=A0A1H2ED44_9BACT|nr:phosphate/phosphite/phosphonate ABC transporter substrate-binding protein [Desulfobacula phenolica]SDT92889.1 phosphonate transport system substrate-binding protein [Desulfobacula phenolica]